MFCADTDWVDWLCVECMGTLSGGLGCGEAVPVGEFWCRLEMSDAERGLSALLPVTFYRWVCCETVEDSDVEENLCEP